MRVGTPDEALAAQKLFQFVVCLGRNGNTTVVSTFVSGVFLISGASREDDATRKLRMKWTTSAIIKDPMPPYVAEDDSPLLPVLLPR